MGWNGSDRRTPSPTPAARPPEVKKPLRAGALHALVLTGVAAVVVGLVWLLHEPAGQDQPKPADKTAREQKKTTTRKPAAIPTNAATPTARPKARAAAEPEPVRTDNPSAVPKAVERPVTTNAAVLAQLEKFKHEPIKGRAAQLLMMLTPLAKGDYMPPAPLSVDPDPQLEKEGQELLESQGVVEEWDTENSIAIKEFFETLREEWREAKASGHTFHQFLQKKKECMEGDHETLEMAKRLDRENQADETLSDADYLKTREKIDKVLKLQGFEGLPAEKDPDAED